MKIKEQTRKLVAGCSKYCLEVLDKTDEVSSKLVLRWQMKLTKSNIYLRQSEADAV
ncbi:chlorohydrolase [Streptococcus pneumoniae]|nr:chlorohydrolase [Streptococcus pneumoniae]